MISVNVFKAGLLYISTGSLIMICVLFSTAGSVVGQQNSLEILNETLETVSKKTGTIVVDPGHGGKKNLPGSSANNAVGKNQTKEKDVALEIAIKVAEYLNAMQHTVHITRNRDTNISAVERVKLARENDADAFVSIHMNADLNEEVQGTETWVDIIQSDKSVLLASSLQQKVLSVTKHRNRGLKTTKKDRPRGIDVLNADDHKIKTAACLIEVSYLTNPKEEIILKDKAYIDSIAKAIAEGIDDYINKATSIQGMDVKEHEFPDSWKDGNY